MELVDASGVDEQIDRIAQTLRLTQHFLLRAGLREIARHDTQRDVWRRDRDCLLERMELQRIPAGQHHRTGMHRKRPRKCLSEASARSGKDNPVTMRAHAACTERCGSERKISP